jgi:hypothetical protein
MRSTTTLLIALALAVPAAAQTMRQEAAGLRFSLPKTWVRVPAPSDVRAAQYRIPGDGGEDGELILYYFGEGKGGGADDNLQRWYGQFTRPDGKPAKDAAVVTMRTGGGLRVTAVDLEGTYTAMAGPGQKADPKPGYRMLGAVIEGAHGPWFFKATGSAKTIGAAKDAFDAMLLSVEAHR